MAWYHRSREYLKRTPDGKLAPAPEKQETKLAEAEEFKPAPVFMEEAPVATSKGELVPVKPEAKKANDLKSVDERGNFAAKNSTAPAVARAIPVAATAPATVRTSVAKPAPKPKSKTLWGSLLGWGKSAEDELEEDLGKDLAEDAEKEKQAQAKPAPKKYYDQPQPEKKLEEKPKQETAVADKFKPAPIAMSTNLPAPANKPASAAKPASPSSTKPAAKQAAVATPAAHSATRLTPEEIAALKAKEATLESQVTTARRAFKTKFETDLEEARKTYPAYARKQLGLIDEMLDLAEQRADATAASSYRKLIIEIRREEPPAKTEKPTLDQYLANPSRYGSTVAPKSSYKPTAADVAKQPFQAPKSTCSGWGYQAAENCKTCRTMADWVHCPCGCGSYIPIDRSYDPFAGQESPSFKGGNPKGGFNSSRFG